MKTKNNKGVVESLAPIFTTLISLAVLVAVGFLIVGAIKDNIKEDSDLVCGTTAGIYNSSSGICHAPLNPSVNTGFSHAWNGTDETSESMLDLPGWLPIIIVALIGGLLLQLTKMFRN